MISCKTFLRDLPGVGPKKETLLAKLDLKSVEDLLFYFPRKYLDRHQIKKISETLPGEVVSLKGDILACEEKRIRRLSIIKFAFSDGTGVVFLTFFNQSYLKDVLKAGQKVFVYGKMVEFERKMQIRNPLYEVIEGSKKLDYFLPVYSLVSGLTQNYLRKMVRSVLENVKEFTPDLLPLPERQRLKIAGMRFALHNIHFPGNQVNLEHARKYLIFDEFFRLQIKLLHDKKMARRAVQVPPCGEPDVSMIEEFEKKLPFLLTATQKKTLREITGDLKSGVLMNRMVQGEVGSGKTVIAVFLLDFWARRGFQGVFLAPTEILAEQHYLNWHPFFLRNGIDSVFLVGSLPARLKTGVLDSISTGEAKVIFGTQALLSEKISYPGLKALVVDEQHKFGVAQRNLLKSKNMKVHSLTMSATPIPRSVALTLYGSVDMSVLGQLPRGPRTVSTFMFRDDEREKVYSFMKDRLEAGEQGYFVAPAIEEDSGFSSVKVHYDILKERFGPFSPGLLHGRLTSGEKSELLDAFREKKIRLLVSTSIIEVGIDVPSASFIVIDQAEKFGLAQLHQLRGRVGRNGETAYCLLVSYSDDAVALERLEAFLEIEDGWKLAEIDLSLRGPGDLFGVRQHGVMPLRIGNIIADIDILNAAREAAGRILESGLYRQKGYERIAAFLGQDDPGRHIKSP